MITGLEYPAALLLALTSISGLYIVYNADNRYKQALGTSRFLLLLLLALAVAGPQMNLAQERMQNTEIIVLEDNSRSMQFMDTDINPENVKVDRKVIASANKSEIKNDLKRHLEPNKAYLLDSDLQTNENLQPVIEEYSKKNSSINFIKTEPEEEHSVYVKGPERTVPGAENNFTVKIHSTKEATVPVKITLDGETIHEGEVEEAYSFTRKFDSKGYHEIKASISVDDRKKENNNYFKTVEVTKKPEILVIGEKGGLSTDLGEYFNLEFKSSLPEGLSEYDSILLKEDVPEEKLIPYVSEGNGLVYTGDYERDYDVLPVKKVPGSDDDNQGVKVVLAVDTSYSLFSEEGTTARNVSASFVSLLGKKSPGSEVAIVNYGVGPRGSFDPRIMRDPDQPAFLPLTYSNDRQRLMNRIDSLNLVPNAIQSKGLKGAKELAERKEGKTAIVMITDGKIRDIKQNGETVITAEKDREEMEKTAKNLDPENPLYFITIGDQADTTFLRRLTSNQNVRSYEYLKEGGKFDIIAGGSSNVGALQIVNNRHFITENTGINSRIVKRDSVEARPSGNLLLSTESGEPALTTWRYGLGRVAAFSADNQNLAGIMRNDPNVAIRTFSWAVGETDREGDWIKVESARRGESRPEAQASYPVEDLTREAGGTFSKVLNPDSLGFHKFEEVPYSYNYNPELQKIGYSDRIEEVAGRTGGEIYSEGEEAQMIEDLKEFGSEEVVRKTSLTPYLLIAALIIFLAEVGFRKFKGRK